MQQWWTILSRVWSSPSCLVLSGVQHLQGSVYTKVFQNTMHTKPFLEILPFSICIIRSNARSRPCQEEEVICTIFLWEEHLDTWASWNEWLVSLLWTSHSSWNTVNWPQRSWGRWSTAALEVLWELRVVSHCDLYALPGRYCRGTHVMCVYYTVMCYNTTHYFLLYTLCYTTTTTCTTVHIYNTCTRYRRRRLLLPGYTTMVLYNLQSTISLMMLGKWVVETIQLPIVHIPRWYLVLSLSCHDKNSEHR